MLESLERCMSFRDMTPITKVRPNVSMVVRTIMPDAVGFGLRPRAREHAKKEASSADGARQCAMFICHQYPVAYAKQLKL